MRSADLMEDKIYGAIPNLTTDQKTAINTANKEAKEEAGPAYLKSELFYLIALIILGTIAILAAVFAFAYTRTIPEYLVALGSASVGAIVGLFAPTPVKK